MQKGGETMLYLNIRTTQPQIGMHSEPSSVETPLHPAELHTTYRAPSSGLAATQVEIEINQYPSRKAYGFLNHDDYAKQLGEKGMQDIKEAIARHVRNNEDMIKNGAKKGSHILAHQARQVVMDFLTRQPKLEFELIPPPEITVIPSRIKGQTDVGEDKVSIQTFPAENKGHPGRVETYLAQKSNVRMWVTEGKYDIYA